MTEAYWIVDDKGRAVTMRRDLHDALDLAEARAKTKGSTMVIRDGKILAICTHTDGFSADFILTRLERAERGADAANDRIARHLASNPKREKRPLRTCGCGAKDWQRRDGPDLNTVRCSKCGHYGFWKWGGPTPRIEPLFCCGSIRRRMKEIEQPRIYCNKPATVRMHRQRDDCRFDYFCAEHAPQSAQEGAA